MLNRCHKEFTRTRADIFCLWTECMYRLSLSETAKQETSPRLGIAAERSAFQSCACRVGHVAHVSSRIAFLAWPWSGLASGGTRVHIDTKFDRDDKSILGRGTPIRADRPRSARRIFHQRTRSEHRNRLDISPSNRVRSGGALQSSGFLRHHSRLAREPRTLGNFFEHRTHQATAGSGRQPESRYESAFLCDARAQSGKLFASQPFSFSRERFR